MDLEHLKLIKEYHRFDQLPPIDQGPVFTHFIGYHPPLVQMKEVIGVEIQEDLLMEESINSRLANLLIGNKGSGKMQIHMGDCDNASTARDVLAYLFTSIMSADFKMTTELPEPIGDGGFFASNDTKLPVLFTYANLTFLTSFSGPDTSPAWDMIRYILEDLTKTPVSSTTGKLPELKEIRLAADTVPLGMQVPFTFSYSGQSDSRIFAKIRTTAGPFTRKDGKLSFTAVTPGDHTINIALISPDGRVVTKEQMVTITS